jgi:uncharacterized membrane protein YphA (DoxX/SURF4 family)
VLPPLYLAYAVIFAELVCPVLMLIGFAAQEAAFVGGATALVTFICVLRCVAPEMVRRIL